MQKLKLIKDRVTISEAITAMCDGLEKQDKRKDFKIVMSSFGDVSTNYGAEEPHKFCYGCAATSAIQEISGINFTTDNHIDFSQNRAKILGFDDEDLVIFEGAIDSLRCGKTLDLFAYYEITIKNEDWNHLQKDLPDLETENWKEGLPAYRMLAKAVKKFEGDNEKPKGVTKDV